ncbi:hypothetical protein D3C76_910720 [compost metagenome]
MMPMGKPPASTLSGLAADNTKKMIMATPRLPRRSSVEEPSRRDSLMFLYLVV